MTQTGFNSPNNKILMAGTPLLQELKIETATNCYPGRFVVRGTNDDDVVVADGIKPVCGILGYEQANVYMPTNIDTLYTASDKAPVLSGAFLGFAPGGLAAGTVATKNDLLLTWTNGQVVPGVNLAGRIAIKVPFVNASGTTQVDTGLDFPAGVRITDCMLNVTTAAAGTLDVGFINAVEGGDEDGLLDGESCAATGLVNHNLVDATAGNITQGALLAEVEIKDATGTPVYYGVPTGYVTDGTIKSLVYTPSNHAIAGFIYVFVESPGIRVIGKAGKTVSAASAAADIQIEALI